MRRRPTRTTTDLRVWADRWIGEALAHRVSKKTGRSLSDRQHADYGRMIRVLVPVDRKLECAALTEEYVTATLATLSVKPQTLRNYVNAWRLFVQWARRKGAPIPADRSSSARSGCPARADRGVPCGITRSGWRCSLVWMARRKRRRR